MAEVITYFGYGANADPQMMEAIIGREPDGDPARLEDHELTIQTSDQMSEIVRGLLATFRNPDELEAFRTYVARPADTYEVNGMAWRISEEEREYVDNWEMNDGLWYRKTSLFVVVGGALVAASTELMDDPELTPAVEMEPDLPVHLNNPPERMLEIARLVREDFDARKDAS